MADRTSAGIFGRIFKLLAHRIEPAGGLTGPGERLAIAQEVWELIADYDFTPYQMECDTALEVLGLGAGD